MKLPRESHHEGPGGERSENESDVLGRELGAPIPLAPRAASRTDPVPHVIRMSPDQQVSCAHAPPLVAAVPDDLIGFRERAVVERIGHVMSLDGAPASSLADTDDPVPSGVLGAVPDPAGVGFLYTSPEAFCAIYQVVHHGVVR